MPAHERVEKPALALPTRVLRAVAHCLCPGLFWARERSPLRDFCVRPVFIAQTRRKPRFLSPPCEGGKFFGIGATKPAMRERRIHSIRTGFSTPQARGGGPGTTRRLEGAYKRGPRRASPGATSCPGVACQGVFRSGGLGSSTAAACVSVLAARLDGRQRDQLLQPPIRYHRVVVEQHEIFPACALQSLVDCRWEPQG